MKFHNIFRHRPKFAVISSFSEVKRDESLTISQIISLHMRGIPANVHMYDEVSYEVGLSNYKDEINNSDYFDMERDLTDMNSITPSSSDYAFTPKIKNDGGSFFDEAQKQKVGASEHSSETDKAQNERSEI